MILIQRIHIEGFRSILDQELSNLGHLTTLVGRNSSGKSNVLRALNLFFNDEVQNGQALSFQRDLHERPKKKKRIRIRVEFSVPSNIKYRKELKHLQILGSSFHIARIWELDKQRNITSHFEVEAGGRPVPNAADIARQFLSIISYRYIPNRTIPADLLRTESQAIADAIFIRMKGDTHAAALLQSLSAAASRMLSGATGSMRATGAPLTSPSVATAATLGEMLRMSGFQAEGLHGRAVQDEDWGSGHQAFFLYCVLQALDTDYSRFFGWRQASIWGVEEPESGLHRDLETRLAGELREWATTEGRRIQIVQTTHSPIFTMAADAGFWVDLSSPETVCTPTLVPQLVRAAELRGVTGYLHPVLSFPWNTVVLVEGAIDEAILSHVATIAGYDHLKFLALPHFDTSEGAGKDSLIAYTRKNAQLIRNRPKEAPLILLFDWEVSSQDMSRARAAYGAGGTDCVIKMDPTACDRLLGEDFKGIERFYPPGVFLAAQQANEIVIAVPANGPYSVSKAQLDRAKAALLNRVKAVTDPTALAPLVSVMKHVDTAVRAYATPQRAFFAEPEGHPGR